MLLVTARSEAIQKLHSERNGLPRRCSKKSRHTPPPGLAFGEPDDRLQRGIQYAATFRFHHWRLWNTGSPAGDDNLGVWHVRVAMDSNFQTAKKRYASAIPRRDAPELCMNVLPSRKQRAWGMPGARSTRSLVRKVLVAHECSHHRSSRIHPAFPHAMVLTVSFVLSPVIGLFLSPSSSGYGFVRARSGRLASAGLGAGVEASGPHDFAVRSMHFSSARSAIAHGKPALRSHHMPNAAASTASRSLRP
jgi:hypothetical protein